MNNKLLTYTIIISGILVGLNIIGFVFPSSLNWGFNFLGFLPSYVLILYLFLASSIFFLTRRKNFQKAILSATTFMDGKPILFLIYSILIFIAFALVFRVKASLLGDSFTLIYNFRDYADNISFLAPWHEPLSIYVLYFSTTFLGSLNYPHIFTSFFVTELILGVGFIFCTFYIVKNIFPSPVQRFLTFVFLLLLPYMEFYFGYIEVYCVSMLLLSIFVLVSVLVLQQKLPFYFVPTTWLLLTLSHYINGLMFFAVLYLAYREYLQKKIQNIVIGFGSATIIFIIILFTAHFEMERLINISPVSHFLSLTNNISIHNAYSQAYTLFSIYHLFDILNYLIFMSPFATLIVGLWLFTYKKGIILDSSFNLFIAIAFLPIFLYYLVAKLEQGNASDWDAFAAHFFLLNLFAAFIFFQRENEHSVKIFSLIICISFLNSMIWFYGNSTKEPNIDRFTSLWDKRNLSHLGNYTHALRLFRYFDSQNDSSRQINVWERYNHLYSEDPRGYANEIEVLNTFTPNDYDRKVQVFERWLSIDPKNDSLRHSFAEVCINAGNKFYIKGKLDSAKIFYVNAIAFNPISPRPYNNLGSVYAQEGILDTAIHLFLGAIKLDSSYAEAYYNIGNAYIDQDNIQKGREFIKHAAQLGNLQAQEFLKSKIEK